MSATQTSRFPTKADVEKDVLSKIEQHTKQGSLIHLWEECNEDIRVMSNVIGVNPAKFLKVCTDNGIKIGDKIEKPTPPQRSGGTNTKEEWIEDRLGVDLTDIDGYQGEDHHYIYVLKGTKTSTDEWYYIGQTTRLSNRIATHIKDGCGPSYVSMDVTDIIELNTIDNYDKEDMRNAERSKAYEIAIEKNTTKVCGGR